MIDNYSAPPGQDRTTNWCSRHSRSKLLRAILATLLVGAVALAATGGVTDESSAVPGVTVAARNLDNGQLDPDVTLDGRAMRPSHHDFAWARARAVKDGTVDVIVGLQVRFTPEGRLAPAAVSAQRADIATERDRVVGAVSAARGRVTRAYRTIPYVALKLPPGAVDSLAGLDAAASVSADHILRPTDDTSGPARVEATEAAAVGRTGTGQTIAILDSGIDRGHVFLQQSDGGPSKVVSEACYSARRNCPGGVKSSTAPGSGEECTYAPEQCYHGTFVAGLAAGRGSTAPGNVTYSGTARGANLISVQVYSRFSGNDCDGQDPCGGVVESDALAGMAKVYSLRNALPIAAVNLSFGRFGSATHCDTSPFKPIIDNLRSVGIATVIASGNEGSTTQVSIPSCVSTAVTVGSSTLQMYAQSAEKVSVFSNSSPLVELLGPGEHVSSSMPDGTFAMTDEGGTSWAAPHVAGAFAVLRALNPSSTMSDRLLALQETGELVTDPRNGVSVPRIRILSASVRVATTGFKAGGSPFGRGWDVSSNGAGAAKRTGGSGVGTIHVADIPAGSTIRQAYLYWMTLGGPDPIARLNGVHYTGALVGASGECQSYDRHQPARVYRAAIPVSAVPGNGVYQVDQLSSTRGSSLSPYSDMDAEGASLLVIFTPPGILGNTVIYIRHGAITSGLNAGTITFPGLFVPSTPLRTELHLGVGNGAAASENPVRFEGTAMTPPNFFTSSNGPNWDDKTMVVPSSLMPAGTTGRTTTHGGVGRLSDCLTAAYGALAVTTPN